MTAHDDRASDPKPVGVFYSDMVTKITYQDMVILARAGTQYILRASLAGRRGDQPPARDGHGPVQRRAPADQDVRFVDVSDLGATTSRILEKYGLPFPAVYPAPDATDPAAAAARLPDPAAHATPTDARGLRRRRKARPLARPAARGARPSSVRVRGRRRGRSRGPQLGRAAGRQPDRLRTRRRPRPTSLGATMCRRRPIPSGIPTSPRAANPAPSRALGTRVRLCAAPAQPRARTQVGR